MTITQDVLDIPAFLRRGHPDCVATVRRPRDQGLVLRAKKPAKRRKARKAADAWTIHRLHNLGWSLAAIRKLSAARAETLAHNRIRPGEERLLDGGAS
jgi:hypothetical protein